MLAALEAGHGDFFFVGGEAAVEQAEAEAGERAGAEFVVHFGGGAEFGAGFASAKSCSGVRAALRGLADFRFRGAFRGLCWLAGSLRVASVDVGRGRSRVRAGRLWRLR